MSAPGDRGDGWRSGVGVGHDQTGADPTTTEDGLGDGCGDEGRTGHDGAGQCRRASRSAARAGGARVARSTLGDVAGKGKHVAWSAWSAIGVEAASRRLANGRRMKRPWDELRARGRMRCPHGLCIRSPFAGDGDIASDPPGVRVVRSLRLLHSRSRSPTANETPKGCSSPDLRTAHNRGSEARATGQRLPPLAQRERTEAFAPRRCASPRLCGRSARRLNCHQFDRGAGRSFPAPGSFADPLAPCERNVSGDLVTAAIAPRAGGRIAPICPTGLPPFSASTNRSTAP